MKRKKRGGSDLRRREPFSPDDKQVPIDGLVAEWQGQGELADDDAIELAWEMHPDLNRMRLKDRLPDELVDSQGNVWSPRMHIDMHALIECQLVNNDPPGIADLAVRFQQAGKLSPHEIRHALAAAMNNQIWRISKEHLPFDAEVYFEEIERCYEEFVDATR